MWKAVILSVACARGQCPILKKIRVDERASVVILSIEKPIVEV